MDEATRLFNQVFFALIRASADTSSFRRIVIAGVTEAQRQLFEQNVHWFDQYINDPANDAVFIDKAKYLETAGGVAAVAERMAEQEITAYGGSVDAASLVFMHSALDGAVDDLCRVIALVAPNRWYEFIDEQSERLGVFRSKGYEAVATERINALVDSLSRESLLKKVDRLFQVCRPDRSYSRKGYQFDRDRLAALDRLRHDIVHRDRPIAPITNAADGIEFINQTGLFLFGMVNHRYGLKLDPEYISRRGDSNV